MITESKSYAYCKWCLEDGNRKVPKYVKKQAQSWLDIVDGKNEQACIDEKAYEKVMSILKILIHPDTKGNMYDDIDDYAMFMITALFVTKTRNDTLVRYYQTVLLKIARKNRKTFYAALIFVLLLLTEPALSRFFSVAPDLKLSSELKIAIKKIIKANPELDEEMFKTMRSEIRCLLNDSDYIPLAYSDDKLDGKFPKAWLADEAGAMDSYPIAAMRSGQIGMRNKLGIIISTEYPNDNNGFIDEVDKAKKSLDGLRKNNRIFSLIYEPDDEYLTGDQWMTEDNITYQSNPVSVTNKEIFDEIIEMREDAVEYQNKRENYLCKHCNIKYKGLGVEGYVEITKVRECKHKEELSFWRGKKVWLGLDFSQSDDNTAVGMSTDDDDFIVSKVWGFIPFNRIDEKSKREDVDYRRLISQGVCFACGDDVIDYGYVEDFVLSLEDVYGVEIVQIGYDRWNALSSVQKFEQAGYECVEIKQHSSVLHAPTKLLKEKILSKKFRYDENLLLEINFQNARCTEDTNRNKYVNKKKSEGKVDMVVAIINSICLLQIELLNRSTNFVVQVG